MIAPGYIGSDGIRWDASSVQPHTTCALCGRTGDLYSGNKQHREEFVAIHWGRQCDGLMDTPMPLLVGLRHDFEIGEESVVSSVQTTDTTQSTRVDKELWSMGISALDSGDLLSEPFGGSNMHSIVV